MNDLSSFSLGPIVGSGLCLVNVAFSKQITIAHIVGGGKFNPKRKNFWQTSRNPIRNIQLINEQYMSVDGHVYDIKIWLQANENLWLEQWLLWSKSVALCSLGDFHWSGESPVIGYKVNNNYCSFVEWKKLAYIWPSYQLLNTNPVFNHLFNVWTHHKRSLALVHPKVEESYVLPMTKEYLRKLYDSSQEMCCMPYVVAGALLGVEV